MMVPSGQLFAATRPDLPEPGIDVLELGNLAPAGGWRRPVLLDVELLVLVTGGHGVVELDFRALSCRPGTLLRARPGQVLRCPAQLDATVVRWRDEALRGLDVDPDGAPAHHQLAGEDEDAVINEVSQLVVDLRRHGADAEARGLLRHQLAVLLLRLALLPAATAPTHRSAGDDPGPSGGPATGTGASGAGATGTRNGKPAADTGRAELATFRRFCREVELGYQHTRRVEDYATRLGCSVRTLTRACLAVTGRSAKQVLDERVALQASRLLAATDQPVARIGRGLGFPEPTNFGRFFTREVGVSPGAFRAAREQSPPRVVRPRRPADARDGAGRA
ncbi:helix-turn-helix transcriptional regulator [Micromonospora sp. NPDC000089]|uniref:helix-turn-helix transcriptional regulator n=1 Tax=unclassified Micromonospora TaxID=2617518 RepID=UPI0036CCAE1D